MRALETVLADAHQEASVLRRNGLVAEAEARERVLREIENATIDWRKWLTEDEACTRSGKRPAYWRSHFPQLLAQDLARYNPLHPKRREYRQCAIPLRSNLDAVRDAAREAALASMEKSA